MIPLALVTGFLGSGKTTLLRALARRHRGRRIVWLVNEFSARDMDAARCWPRDARTWSPSPAAASSAAAWSTEFIDQLREPAGALRHAGRAVEGVVVEASGMAESGGRRHRCCARRGWTGIYRTAAVVAVVDPGSFLKLLHTLPNIRAQIEAASCVLLNKTDLHSAGADRADGGRHPRDQSRGAHTRAGLLRDRRRSFRATAAVAARGELAALRGPDFVSSTRRWPAELT